MSIPATAIQQALARIGSFEGNLQERTANINTQLRQTFLDTTQSAARLAAYNRSVRANLDAQTQQIRAAQKAAEEEIERLEFIDQTAATELAGAEASAFSNLRERDRKNLDDRAAAGDTQAIALQAYFRDQDLQTRKRSIQEAARRVDPGDSKARDKTQAFNERLDAIDLALSRNTEQRRTQVGDEQYSAIAQQGQFQELYRNRGGSDPLIDVPRNILASATRGIGGAGSLLQSALGFDDAGQRTQEATQSLSDFLDVQTPQANVQNTAIGAALEQGDITGALSNLGGASALSLLENIGGAVVGGGGIGIGARAGARAVGAAAGRVAPTATAALGQSAQALGTAAATAAPGATALAQGAARLAPLNLGIQGQSFQQGALDPGDGRQAQALTQLAGAGVLSGAGAAFPLLSGLEGAIASRSLGALQGANTGSRTLNTGLGALRGAATEGVQEGAEAIIEQGARGVGTGEGFVDAINPGSVLAQSALGAVVGAPIGAGAGFSQRVNPAQPTPVDQSTTSQKPVTPDQITPQTFDPATFQPPQTIAANDLFTDSAYYGPVNQRPALDIPNIQGNPSGQQTAALDPIAQQRTGTDSQGIQQNRANTGVATGLDTGAGVPAQGQGGAVGVAAAIPASGVAAPDGTGVLGAQQDGLSVPGVADRGQPAPITQLGDAGEASTDISGIDIDGAPIFADPTANLDDPAFDQAVDGDTVGTGVRTAAGGAQADPATGLDNGSPPGDGGSTDGTGATDVSAPPSALPQLSSATGRNGRSSRNIEGYGLSIAKVRKTDGALVNSLSRRGATVLVNEAYEIVYRSPEGVENIKATLEAFNNGEGVTAEVAAAVEAARQSSSLGEPTVATVNAEAPLETLEQVSDVVEQLAMGQSPNDTAEAQGTGQDNTVQVQESGASTASDGASLSQEPEAEPGLPADTTRNAGGVETVGTTQRGTARNAPDSEGRIRARNRAAGFRDSADISESFDGAASQDSQAQSVDYGERAIRRDLSALVPNRGGGGSIGFDIVDPSTISPELDARIEADTGSRFADNAAIVYRDQIIINPRQISDASDLEVVLAHEILGHAGLRAKHGPSLDTFLDRLYRDLGGVDGVVARAESMGVNIRDGYADLISRANSTNSNVVDRAGAQRAITEELIAGLSERGGLSVPQMNILQSMGARVRAWLRENMPGVANFFRARQVADWELATFAAEASKAGRALVDRGQHVDTVRAFAARPYRTRNAVEARLRQYDSKPAELKNSYDRLFNSGDILGELGSFASRTRTRLAEARTNDDNWWNQFKNELVNNRNGLQNAFIKGRRNWGTSAAKTKRVFDSADSSIAKASTSERVRVEDRENANILQAGLRFAVTKGFTVNKSGRMEHLKELLNLSDQVTLKESRAGGLYTRAMQTVEGQLEASLTVLELALKKSADAFERVSRGEAYDTANEFIRASHAIERNRNFFFHPDKNEKVLKELVGTDKYKELRQLYNSQFNDNQNNPNLAQQVEAFVMRNLTPAGAVEIQEALPAIRTIGLTTAEAQQILDDIGVNPETDNYDQGLHESLLQVNTHLQEVNNIADGAQRDAGMGSVLFDRAVEYNGFDFYFPHYEVRGNDNAITDDTDYMSSARYADRFMTEIGVATGSEQIGAVPLVAARHQAERKFADIGDNDVGQSVLAVWAASQDSAEFREALEDDWGDAEVSIVNKNTKDEKGNSEWLNLAGQHRGDTFLYHLPPGLKIPGRSTRESPGDSGQYVVAIKYGNKSRIPSLVKGKRTNQKVIRDLRENHPTFYNGARGTTRLIGSMHTRYNFLNYPVKALVRDTLQAFATIGAAEGSSGLKAFVGEGLTAATRDAKPIAEYLWTRSQAGEKAAARLAEMRKDPQLKDFIDFIDSGAFTANPRSFSLEGRHDELVRGLTNGRVLTGTERNGLAQADQAISMLSIMGDVLGRYAMYKAQRMLGKGINESAVEAKNLANFEQRGQGAKADIGAMLYVFFRPSLIGLTQIVDTALDSEYNLEAAGVALGLSGALFALGTLLAPEDENGNNKFISQGSDGANYKLFIGDNAAIQIPYGYNGFSAITAMGMQALFGAYSEQTPVQTANNMFDVLTNNLSPVTNNIPITDNGRFSLANATKKAFDLVAPTVAGVPLGLAFNVTNFGAPIVRDYGTGASTVGKVFDSTSAQTGGFSEALVRGLFNDVGLPIPIGTADYLFGELASGPRNVIDSAFEAYRAVTGSDTPINAKRLSLGFGGLLASPYNPQVGNYWDTRAKANDLIENEKFLANAGYTQEDIGQRMRRMVGDGEYERLLNFKVLDDGSGLRDIMREARGIRASTNLSGEERIDALRINRSQAEQVIANVFSELNR